MTYDWLDDDGRLWFPESKAFWLEPETEAQLLAWFRRYRPAFRGTVTAAGMTIEVGDPPQATINPYANYYQQAGLQQAWNYQNLLQANHTCNRAHSFLGPGSLFGNLL